VAGGAYYVVEDVLGVRTAGSGGREFLVRWQDYEGPDTWEPEDNLRPSLVREFMESQEEEAELPSAAPATAPAAAPATAPAAAPAAAPGAVPTTEPTGRRTGGGKSKKRQAGSSDVQPRAAPAAAQLSVPKLVVGARMEVQACSEDCDFVCSDPRCLWEACTVLADHGAVCDVCITEDEDVCKDCVAARCGLRQERQESAQQWRLRSRRLPQSRHGLRLRRLIYRRLRLHQHRRRRRCLRPRRLQSAKPQVTSRLPQRTKVQGAAEYHVY